MTAGACLQAARVALGWTQADTAAHLGVSQAYVSQLESGRRRLPARRAREFMRKLPYRGRLPPTVLPVASRVSRDELAAQLGSLGYPRFEHVRAPAAANPANVLLGALKHARVEARVVEALPWLVLRYPEMDWDWLVVQAKLNDLQNSLGFVVTLARELAEREAATGAAAWLREVETRLERSKLARADLFCQAAATDAERRWLETRRSPEAARWNLLTDLSPDTLRYDADTPA
jgi:transcriptional regulator with XRE-family HTH domain